MKKDKSFDKLILEAHDSCTIVLLSSNALHSIFMLFLRIYLHLKSAKSIPKYCLPTISFICKKQLGFVNSQKLTSVIWVARTILFYFWDKILLWNPDWPRKPSNPFVPSFPVLGFAGMLHYVQLIAFYKRELMLSNLTHEHKGLHSFCLVWNQYFQKINSWFTFFKYQ